MSHGGMADIYFNKNEKYTLHQLFGSSISVTSNGLSRIMTTAILL